MTDFDEDEMPNVGVLPPSVRQDIRAVAGILTECKAMPCMVHYILC